MSTRVVLVPGFWMGAWAWDQVAPMLAEQGLDVVAVTLPGQGEEGTGDVSVADQAAAIVAALDEPADRRILVVHSGAAFPGTVALDRRPDLVDRLVLVDTAPPQDGLAFAAEATADLTLDQSWADLEEEGSFTGLSEAQLASFRERAVPVPVGVVATPVELRNTARHSVPITAICTLFHSSSYQEYAAQGVPFLAALLEYEDVSYVDLPTGHWPMWSEPEALARIITEAAAS